MPVLVVVLRSDVPNRLAFDIGIIKNGSKPKIISFVLYFSDRTNLTVNVVVVSNNGYINRPNDSRTIERNSMQAMNFIV